MNDDGGWIRRSSRHLFRSRWYNLRQDELTLPSGEEVTYTLVEHPGFVVVVPLLADGRVVMERIFRHTVQRTLLECPRGGRDGEAPGAAARRELEEETGYRARTWENLGRYYASTGISDEAFDVFLATDLSADGTIRRESTEQIEVDLIELAELQALALSGRLEDATSALAILLAWNRVRGG